MADRRGVEDVAARLLRDGDLHRVVKVCTAATTRFVESAHVFRAMRGLALARLGDLEGAEADVLAALPYEPRSLRLHQTLIEIGRGRGTLEAALGRLAEAAIGTSDEDLALLYARECDALLWPSGGIACLAAVARRADAVRVRSALAHRYAYARDFEPCASLLRGDDSFEALSVRFRAALAVPGADAVALATSMTGRARTDDERRTTALSLMEAGLPREALAYARSEQLHSLSAKWAIWSGDLSSADSTDDPMLLAAISALRDDWSSVLAHAERRLVHHPDDGEAWHWRGEALRNVGSREESLSSFERAARLSDGYVFALELNRALAKQHLQEVEWLPWLVERYGEGSRSPDVGLRAVAALLRSLHGNRSGTPTTLQDGRWLALETPRSARREARHLQMRVRTRPDAAISGLEAMAREQPELPIAHTHRGEVLLWMGRYDEARRAFERALELDAGTRWAWVGLGAAQMYSGAPARALATWAESADRVILGRTTWVYRAEAHWRLGERAPAAEALDAAVELNPG